MKPRWMASPPFRQRPGLRLPVHRSLQQAAAELGFTPEQGRQLAIETVQGAAALAAQSSEPASVLRERVTSKGGTTEAALNKMAEMGVKEGIIAGVKAAEARGQELGKLLGAA
jgi:pyrroline-5-carboxylate reductase